MSTVRDPSWLVEMEEHDMSFMRSEHSVMTEEKVLLDCY